MARKLVQELVNPETGELVKVMLIGFDKPKDKGYVKLFTAFLADVLRDPELFGKAGKLLLYVAEKLEYESLEVQLYYKQVCKELKIHHDTFYSWLNTLLKKGFLEKVKDKPHTYRLKVKGFVKGSFERASENSFKTLELFEQKSEQAVV